MITKSKRMRKRQGQKGILSLLFKMFFDGSAATKGINKTKAKTKTAAQKMESYFKPLAKSIGAAFAIRGVMNFGKEVMKQAADFLRWSKILGVTTKVLQEMNYAATQNGMNFTHVTETFKFLAKAVSMANQGMPEKITYFRQLGVTMKEMQGMTLDQLFFRIADNLAQMETIPPELIKAIDETFGEKGVEMLGVFKAGLTEIAEEATRAGVVISETTLQALSDAGAKWEHYKSKAIAVFAPILGGFALLFEGIFIIIEGFWITVVDLTLGFLKVIANNIVTVLGSAFNSVLTTAVGALDWMGLATDGMTGWADAQNRFWDGKVAKTWFSSVNGWLDNTTKKFGDLFGKDGFGGGGEDGKIRAWGNQVLQLFGMGKKPPADDGALIGGGGLNDGAGGGADQFDFAADMLKAQEIRKRMARADFLAGLKTVRVASGWSEQKAEASKRQQEAIDKANEAGRKWLKMTGPQLPGVARASAGQIAEAEEEMKKLQIEVVKAGEARQKVVTEEQEEKDKKKEKLLSLDVDKVDKDTLARIGGRLGGQAAEVNIQKAQLQKLNSLVQTFGSVDRAIQILVK